MSIFVGKNHFLESVMTRKRIQDKMAEIAMGTPNIDFSKIALKKPIQQDTVTLTKYNPFGIISAAEKLSK